MDREVRKKNKYLAEKMGICWHEWSEYGYCEKPSCADSVGIRLIHENDHPNIDYYTAEGRQRLLEWAVKEEWWREFLYQRLGSMLCDVGDRIQTLLIPESALAEAVYLYLKEREDG